MIDRLIGVGGEFAAWQPEALVEVDRGAEGEDARGDAGEQPVGGAAAVAFEQKLVFEAVDDRLDPLPDPADRRVGPVGFVGPAGPQEQGAQLANGVIDAEGWRRGPTVGVMLDAGTESTTVTGVTFRHQTFAGINAFRTLGPNVFKGNAYELPSGVPRISSGHRR